LKQVHQSFEEAGSDAITTNSYGIVPGAGFSLPEIVRHVDCAGRIARESVLPTTLLLGSLGPLMESYRPDLILPHEQGLTIYAAMAKALAPYVDCFLAETISSYDECIQIVDAVDRLEPTSKSPFMASFTLDENGNFRSGETVTDGISRLLHYVKKHQNVERKFR
jgi:methionine synthase I (cobalamin-dependent)